MHECNALEVHKKQIIVKKIWNKQYTQTEKNIKKDEEKKQIERWHEMTNKKCAFLFPFLFISQFTI